MNWIDEITVFILLNIAVLWLVIMMSNTFWLQVSCFSVVAALLCLWFGIYIYVFVIKKGE